MRFIIRRFLVNPVQSVKQHFLKVFYSDCFSHKLSFIVLSKSSKYIMPKKYFLLQEVSKNSSKKTNLLLVVQEFLINILH
jgi:hypothetical protein